MSKQINLRNRLDDLFADLEQEAIHLPAGQESLPGWTWECDSQGYYTACSPEVERTLGVEAAAFLGQPLTSFRVARQSAGALAGILQAGNFPAEATLQFQVKDGSQVSVRAHISHLHPGEGTESGWRGFNQVVTLDQPATAGHPAPQSSNPEPVTAPTLPPSSSLSGAYPYGIAVEAERAAFPVSTPYTSVGELSMLERQTFAYTASPDTPAALAVPVNLQEQSLGLLEIIDDSPNRIWSQDDQRLVEQVADQLSLALENARLFQNTKTALARTEALFRVGQSAISFESITDLLQSVADTIAEVLPAARTLVAVINLDKEELTHLFQSNAPPIPIEKDTFQQFMDGLTGWCIREHKPALSLKEGIDPRESEEASSTRKETDAGSLVVVPMLYQDKIYGTLTAINTFTQPDFTQSDVELLTAMASQVATALANAQLFQQEQHLRRIADTLSETARVVSSTLDLKDVGDRLLVQLADVVEFDTASLQMIEGDQSKRISVYSRVEDRRVSSHPKILRSISQDPLINAVIQSRQPLVLTDTLADPRWKRLPEAALVRSWIAAPLLIQDEVIGMFTLDHSEPGVYDEETADLLSAIAAQVSVAVRNARLFEQTQQRSEELALINRVVSKVSASLDVSESLQIVTTELGDALDVQVNIALLNPDGVSLTMAADYSPRQENPFVVGYKIPITGNPSTERVFETKKPVIIEDPQTNPLIASINDLMRSLNVQSMGIFPMIIQEEIYGTVGIYILDEGRTLTQGEIQLVETILVQAATAVQNARLFEQIQARSTQLQTAAEVSRAASSILEPDPLIRQTVNLIRERFDLYYVGFFLVDESGEGTNEPGKWAVLRAGTGEAGRIQVERGHKLEVGGGSMISECITSTKAQTPHRVSDTTQRFVNPLLPETRTEIALPLVSRGQVLGAMSIQSDVEDAFSAEDVAVLQTMADQVANAIQNANLFDQTQARAAELTMLNEMSRALSSNLDTDTILRNIYLYASRLIDTSTFFVALYNAETNNLSFPLAIEDNQYIDIPTRPLETGLTEYVIKNREAVLIHEEVEGWLRDHGVELRLTGAMSQSWLGVPMLIGEQTIGIICVQNETPRHFSERHRDLLIAIASQSAIAIQNAQLFSQTQEALADTETLLTITRVASSSLELETTLGEVLDQVLTATDSDAGLISIFNPTTQTLELVSHRLPDTLYENLREHGLAGTLCDLVYQGEEPVIVENLAEDAPVDVTGLLALGFQSYRGIPLEAKGIVLGSLCIFKKEILAPQEISITLLQAACQQIGVAIENANLFEQTQTQAADLAVLNEMSRVLTDLREIDKIVDSVYDYTSRLMDTTIFYIAFYDEDTDEIARPLTIVEGERIDVPSRKLRRGLTEYIIRTGEPLLIEENVLAKMEELGIELSRFDMSPALSWLGAPFLIGDRAIGVISVQSTSTPRRYNSHHRDLLMSIASQTAISIQNARLFAQTQKRSEELALINRVVSQVAGSLDLTESLQIVATELGQAMGVQTGIAFLNPKGATSTVAAAYSPNPDRPPAIGLTFQVEGNPSSQRVMMTKKPLVIEDAQNDPLTAPIHAMMRSQGIVSLAILPLITGGKVIGTVGLDILEKDRKFTDDEIRLAETIVMQAANAIENARLFADSQQHVQDLTTLSDVSQSLVSAPLDVKEVADIIVRQFVEAMGIPEASVLLVVDGNTLEIIADIYQGPGEEYVYDAALGKVWPLSESTASSQVLDTLKPQVIRASDSDIAITELTHLEAHEVGTLVIIPLVVKGQAIGIIKLEIWDKEVRYTSDQLNLAVTLANQAAVSLENARLFAESQQHVQDLTTLSSASQNLASAPLESREVALVIAHQFLEVTKGQSTTSISIRDSANPDYMRTLTNLRFKDGEIFPDENPERWDFALSNYPATAKVLGTSTPLIIHISDPDADPNELAYMREHEIRTLAIIPLAVKGQTIGIIELESWDEEHHYSQDEINL
ncbi:MAG: GAF domain-containing protein, partial [Chloroflexi bacterium]|nr:GAF domain-containing protein [Chloroflexota bacterium]